MGTILQFHVLSDHQLTFFTQLKNCVFCLKLSVPQIRKLALANRSDHLRKASKTSIRHDTSEVDNNLEMNDYSLNY